MPAVGITSTVDDCDPASPDATDWIDCTREQAALGSLTSTQTVTTWYGTAAFVPAPPAPGPDVPQFKRLVLTAWLNGEPTPFLPGPAVSTLTLTPR